MQTPDGTSKRKKGKEKPVVEEVVKPVDPPKPVVEPEPVVAPEEVPKSVGPALVFLEEKLEEKVVDAPVEDAKQVSDEPAKVEDQADDKVEKKTRKQKQSS